MFAPEKAIDLYVFMLITSFYIKLPVFLYPIIMFENNENKCNVVDPAFTAEDRDVRRTTSLITTVIRKTMISIHRKKGLWLAAPEALS